MLKTIWIYSQETLILLSLDNSISCHQANFN